ncbi:MAG: hypothetical protein QM681_10490 [Novosphingobium sp.]
MHAVWRGGAPERLVAAALLAAACATAIVTAQSTPFRHIEWAVFWIDLALTCTLMAIALRADRFWPMWITAMQCVALAGHGARGFDPHLLPLAYWLLIGKLSYPMMLILFLGTERHHRRTRSSGPQMAWSR